MLQGDDLSTNSDLKDRQETRDMANIHLDAVQEAYIDALMGVDTSDDEWKIEYLDVVFRCGLNGPLSVSMHCICVVRPASVRPSCLEADPGSNPQCLQFIKPRSLL